MKLRGLHALSLTKVRREARNQAEEHNRGSLWWQQKGAGQQLRPWVFARDAAKAQIGRQAGHRKQMDAHYLEVPGIQFKHHLLVVAFMTVISSLPLSMASCQLGGQPLSRTPPELQSI